MNDIIKHIESGAVDYDALNIVADVFWTGKVDINIIIPVRGRHKFVDTVVCKLSSLDTGSYTTCITIVEHDHIPSLAETANKHGVNYIGIECKKEDFFNKCLCMNIGAFCSVDSRYLLFHDADLMVNDSFIMSVMSNVESKDAYAMQCFFGRRVLFCDAGLTHALTGGYITDELSIDYPGVYQKQSDGKAPGGSILVDRELFNAVGGYDPELWHSYSPEDLFFWDKLNLFSDIHTCDEPVVEVYHLDHPLQESKNPHFRSMLALYNQWKTLTDVEKKQVCHFKRSLIEQYI